jgi:hypothetical protein
MLIRENLLRNMIRHVLTQKLLREDTGGDLDFNANEILLNSESFLSLKNLVSMIKAFDSYKPIDNQRLLTAIIWQLIRFISDVQLDQQEEMLKKCETVFSSLLNGDTSTEKLFRVMFMFIKRIVITEKNKKVSPQGIEAAINKFYIGLGLMYHAEFILPDEKEEDKDDKATGTATGKKHKNQAIVHVITVIKENNLLDGFIKNIESDLSPTQNATQNEENKSAQTDSKDETGVAKKDSQNNFTIKPSMQPIGGKFMNANKDKRSVAEVLIRSLENPNYGDTIENIFKDVFTQNVQWKQRQKQFTDHIERYTKALTSDEFKKHGPILGEVRKKLIEFINQLLDKALVDENGNKQKLSPANQGRLDFVKKDSIQIVNHVFDSAEIHMDGKAMFGETVPKAAQKNSTQTTSASKNQNQVQNQVQNQTQKQTQKQTQNKKVDPFASKLEKMIKEYANVSTDAHKKMLATVYKHYKDNSGLFKKANGNINANVRGDLSVLINATMAFDSRDGHYKLLNRAIEFMELYYQFLTGDLSKSQTENPDIPDTYIAFLLKQYLQKANQFFDLAGMDEDLEDEDEDEDEEDEDEEDDDEEDDDEEDNRSLYDRLFN